jgi:DNA primase
MSAAASELRVGKRTLKVTNLDKLLYPREKFTKGEAIAYYLSVADVIIPHLKDRPLTLKRYPDGVTAKQFYEKQCPPLPAGLAGDHQRREQEIRGARHQLLHGERSDIAGLGGESGVAGDARAALTPAGHQQADGDGV